MRQRILAAILLVVPNLVGQRPSAGVIIRNVGPPGGVEIENAGPAISLASKVVVERMREGKWITANVTYELITTCAGSTPSCTSVSAGARMTPLPWNGYTCSGQCNRSCRSNHYAGPGTFRFVVLSCDKKQRFEGPEFNMPAERRP